MISNWWAIVPAILLAILAMYLVDKFASRRMYAAMKTEGLTDQDIIDIVGQHGFNKMKAA